MDQGALKIELADHLEIHAPEKRTEHAPFMSEILRREYSWHL
jgi:hypothetical protein